MASPLAKWLLLDCDGPGGGMAGSERPRPPACTRTHHGAHSGPRIQLCDESSMLVYGI